MGKIILYIFGFCLGLLGVNILGVYLVAPNLLPESIAPIIYYTLCSTGVFIGLTICIVSLLSFKLHHTTADLLKVIFVILFIVTVVLLSQFLKNILATCFVLSFFYVAVVLLLFVFKSYGWRGNRSK